MFFKHCKYYIILKHFSCHKSTTVIFISPLLNAHKYKKVEKIMSIFTDSLYFQFHLLAFYSQRSGRRCWHFQGKRAKKLHYFFRFVLMTVVGIIVVVQHLLITYISFDFFSFTFRSRRIWIGSRYVSIIVDFSLHLIIMEIIFVGEGGRRRMADTDTDFDGFFAVCHFCLPTQNSSHTTY